MRAMRCMACGGEMILVNVVQDDTTPVSGFEHHTSKCSECQDEERRLVFTSHNREGDTEPAEQAPPVVPASSTQDENVAASGLLSCSEPPKTVPVEPTQTVSPEPTHPELPAAMPKTHTRAKALDEKLRNLKERAEAARAAAGETARLAQFNRDQDDKSRPVPPPSASSEGSNHVKPNEPSQHPTEPIVSPAPIAHDEPIVPGSTVPAATKFRDRLGQLVSAMRRRELSKVR
jgi:hypothetical protein